MAVNNGILGFSEDEYSERRDLVTYRAIIQVTKSKFDELSIAFASYGSPRINFSGIWPQRTNFLASISFWQSNLI